MEKRHGADGRPSGQATPRTAVVLAAATDVLAERGPSGGVPAALDGWGAGLGAEEGRHWSLSITAALRARELALLHQVRTSLAGALEPSELFRVVVEAVAEALGYSQVSLYLREGDELELQHQVGYDRVLARVAAGTGVSWRVVETGEPVLIEDVTREPAFLGAIAGIVSEICVPLRDAGRVIGVLNVESTEGMRLTEEDLRLIVALGEYVGVAFEVARLHDAVRASEARYGRMVRGVSDIVAVVEADGTVRDVNPAADRVLGNGASTIVGGDVFGLVHAEDEAKARRAFGQLAAQASGRGRVEVRLRHRDGSWRWLEVAGSADGGANGGGLVLTARDVTERRETEAALREAEERFRCLADAGFEAISVHDGKVILDANRVHATMFGFEEPSEVIGRSILDVIAPGSRETVRRRVIQGWEAAYEIEGRRRDGSTFPAEIRGRAIPYRGGVARVVALRDVSERKALEGEARRREREQAARLRVSQAATSSLDLGRVVSEVARACLGAAGAECCGVCLCHAETGEMELLAEETIPEWPGVGEGVDRYPTADWTLHRLAIKERRSVAFAGDDERLTEAERRYYAAAGAAAVLLVPLLLGGDCLGLLMLHARGRDAFGEREARLAAELGLPAAEAIRNARFVAEARAAAEEQKALLRVSQAVASGQPLPAVLAAVCQAALGVAGAEACGIAGWRPIEGELEAIAGETVPTWPGTVSPGARFALEDWPTSRQVLETSEARRFTLDEPTLTEVERRGYEADGVGAVLIVPLRWGATVLGLLSFYARGRRPFGARAERFAGELASEAAQAIERSRLVEAEERERARTAALLRAAAALNQAGSLDAVMAGLAAAAAAAVGVDRTAVFAYDRERTRTIAVGRFDAERLGGPPRFPAPETEIAEVSPLAIPAEAKVIRTRRPLVRDGAGPWLPRFPPDDWRSDVVVPLIAEGEVQGVLYARNAGRERRFDDEEIALLQAIGHQAGLSILRARDAEAAARRADHLALINQVGRALSDTVEIGELCASLHREVSRVVVADAFSVALVEHNEAELWVPFLIEGGERGAARRVPVDGGAAGEVLRTRQSSARRGGDEPIVGGDEAIGAARKGRGCGAVLCVPMLAGEEVIGLLTVGRDDAMAYGSDDLRTLETIAELAAGAVRRAELVARNRNLYLGSVKALVATVDAKDPYTRGHSERVSRLAGEVARALGMVGAEAEAVELAGLLHDVGKIGVPDAILQKPAPLDDAERATMMGHAALGGEILAAAGTEALRALVPLVRHHHERVDGQGYPDGLAGEAIPLGAAIIGAADAFDTLVTARTYRPATTVAKALAELRRAAGRQFRPEVVAALARLARGELGVEIDAADGAAEPMPPGRRAGQIGDPRALGLLVELAAETRHIPDIDRFLSRVARAVRRRLGYPMVTILLLDGERRELVLAGCDGVGEGGSAGYRQSIDDGVLGWVVRQGRPRRVPDVGREADFVGPWPNPRGSELAVPLVVGGETIGVINVETGEVGAFTEADEAVLTAVAGQLAAAVQVAQLHDAAKRAATTDGLTGLANHRAFYEALEAASGGGEAFSLVLLDVEGLKRVNDSAGHLAGDAVLRRVGHVIRDLVREEDVVARYGGDEFAVIQRGRGRSAAEETGAAIRAALCRDGGGGGGGGGGGEPMATVRYGVASAPEDWSEAMTLVATADRRLYRMRAGLAPSSRR